jgi:diguanylate cyclase (GGDEF)-like protein
MDSKRFFAGIARVLPIRRRTDAAVFLSAGATLIIASLLVVGATICQLRTDALNAARRGSANLALILAEQTERSFQAFDLVLHDVQNDVAQMAFASPEAFESGLTGTRIHSWLRAKQDLVPNAAALVLVSARGRAVNWSRSFAIENIDFSDRDYFQHFLTNLDRNMFVSVPVRSRVTGDWTVFLARSITTEGGQFIGAVLVLVELKYFESIFSAIELPRHETFALLRRDGTLLIRYPDTVERAGYVMPSDSPWFATLARGGGYFQSSGDFDGQQRMAAMQPLNAYPLVLDVAVTEKAALAEWYHQAFFILAIAASLLAFAGFLLRMVRRQLQRLRGSEASLTQQNEDLVRLSDELTANKASLAEKSHVLEMTLASMDQGLAIIDADARVVLFNSRAGKLLELPESFLASTPTLRDIAKYQWDTNQCGRELTSFEEFARPLQCFDRQRTHELRWPSGRVVEIRSVPRSGGGAVQTYSDITQRKHIEERTNYFAHHDDLTRLANRSTFRKRLEQEMGYAGGDGSGLSVFYLDLDHFKQVNDNRGHEVGDRVLVEVAKRMCGAVRTVDTVARIGGDEFGIILPFLEDRAAAELLAQRLIALVADPIMIDGEAACVGVSIGIALFPGHGKTIDALLRHADQALYRAKNSGRNTYCTSSAGATDYAQAERCAS